jgi:hypothetical protein
MCFELKFLYLFCHKRFLSEILPRPSRTGFSLSGFGLSMCKKLTG